MVAAFSLEIERSLLIIYQSVCLPARISSPVQSMVDTPLSFCCTNQKLSDDIIALSFDGKDNENYNLRNEE